MSGGRPYASQATKKGVTLRFRCTTAEDEELKRRAEAVGMSLSAWVRSRLLGDDTDDKAGPRDEGEVSPEPAGCGPLK